MQPLPLRLLPKKLKESGCTALSRPAQAIIRKRIRQQIADRNQTAPLDQHPRNIGTSDYVLANYQQRKAKSWADPASPPADLGQRMSFLDDSDPQPKSLNDLGLMSRDGRPNIVLRFPELRTGKAGRGLLGKWGPNHAIDTIVTRRRQLDRKQKAAETESHKSGLQVALIFRTEDQVWAIPGKFPHADDLASMSTLGPGVKMTGDLPSSLSEQQDDQARLAVRRVFELEGIPAEKLHEYKDVFDELFKKSSQTLVYRGYSDDPRNTDDAWVETSAWHVHCPAELGEDLDSAFSTARNAVMWMDIVVAKDRLDFEDQEGNRYDLFASHRELIELAVFGNVLGNDDMPFEYTGRKTDDEGEIAPLNPNHSHYICIDNGTTGQFGVEVAIRSELESFMSCYDYDARSKAGSDSIAELTDYFEHCLDASAVHVAGELCPGGRSPPIPLDDASGSHVPTSIQVERTASNGRTKMAYTITVVRSDAAEETSAVQASKKRAAASAKLRRRSSSFSLRADDVNDICVSDGLRDYYPEARFDPSKPDEYEVRVPQRTEKVTVTVFTRAAATKDIQTSVPIVSLCYGGGPMTLETLAGAGDKPIIVVRGSQRTAQFIEDWCAAHAVLPVPNLCLL